MDHLLLWDEGLFIGLRAATRSGLGDAFYPWLTDLDNFRIPLLVLWLALVLFAGRKGRVAALLLIVVVALTDQVTASILKPWVGRVRPCFALDGVDLLIPQSRSPSFPSSHAANGFGAALFLALRLGRGWWAGLFLAALISFSRIYVGVHYPLDALGGACLGAGTALLVHGLFSAQGPARRVQFTRSGADGQL